jgi:hypothetical protein
MTGHDERSVLAEDGGGERLVGADLEWSVYVTEIPGLLADL